MKQSLAGLYRPTMPFLRELVEVDESPSKRYVGWKKYTKAMVAREALAAYVNTVRGLSGMLVRVEVIIL